MSLDAGDSVVGISTGVGIANTFTAWTSFTPALADIRDGSSLDSQMVSNLRHGEFAAVVVGGGVAAVVSVAVGSPLPLLTSALLLVGLIVLYEYTLHHSPFSSPR